MPQGPQTSKGSAHTRPMGPAVLGGGGGCCGRSRHRGGHRGDVEGLSACGAASALSGAQGDSAGSGEQKAPAFPGRQSSSSFPFSRDPCPITPSPQRSPRSQRPGQGSRCIAPARRALAPTCPTEEPSSSRSPGTPRAAGQGLCPACGGPSPPAPFLAPPQILCSDRPFSLPPAPAVPGQRALAAACSHLAATSAISSC